MKLKNIKSALLVMVMLSFASVNAQNRLQLSSDLDLLSPAMLTEYESGNAFRLKFAYQNYNTDKTFRSKIFTYEKLKLTGKIFPTDYAEHATYMLTFRRGATMGGYELDDRVVPYYFGDLGIGAVKSEETLFNEQFRRYDVEEGIDVAWLLGMGFGMEFTITDKLMAFGELSFGYQYPRLYTRVGAGISMRLY